MSGPLFDSPPQIGGAPFPEINVRTDKFGDVKIPQSEWDKLVSHLRGGVLIEQRSLADLEQYLERLTKFLAANYD